MTIGSSPERFIRFEYRDATYLISCDGVEAAKAAIIRERDLLDAYVSGHRSFLESYVPIEPAGPEDPEIVRRMIDASCLAGVGPMAAVAGAIAQVAVDAMVDAGAAEAIVNNGGDIFIHAGRTITIGLYTGRRESRDGRGKPSLALRLKPEMLPCAVCSSSALMGHSDSLGRARLATVVVRSGALADAAATALCNAAVSVSSAGPGAERIAAIEGVSGVLVVVDDSVVIAGGGIDLVRHRDADIDAKVVAHVDSDFSRGVT